MRDTLSVTRYLLKRYPVEKLSSEWSQADDAFLRKLVVKRGSQWTLIGKEMCRSPEMVRLRYRDYVSLGKTRVKGEWSEDELMKLYKTVLGLLKETEWRKEMGLELEVLKDFIDWGSVSKVLGNRNRLQCRDKWTSLERWKYLVE